MIETPAELGYRWPAEWEPHRATWLSWPHNRDTWPGKYAHVRERFTELVQVLAQFEPVMLLAADGEVRRDADKQVGHLSNVQLIDIPTDDAWCRDHGPSFLVGAGKQPALVDWGYNAWGGKYPPFDQDNDVPRRIAETFGYRRFQPDLVLEGGAIDSNGGGTFLAAGSCLLNANRNPGRSRREVEQLLAAYLGATRTIWLARGVLAGDDTDGHVDQLARFTAPTTLVAAVAQDRHDVDYEPLQENLGQLRELIVDGRAVDVVPLPRPAAMFAGSQRLPASYCNFYIANGAVLVPQFGDPADDTALGILRDLFADRAVIGFDAAEIIWGLGAIHCLTQQEGDPRCA